MFRKTLTLSDARQALTLAEERLADWRRQAEEAERHRTQVEARLGEDALAATDGGAAIREALNTARIDFDVATAAVPAAEVKVHEARQDVLLAGAGHLRSRASDLHREAKQQRDAIRPLLEQLEQVADCRYRPVSHVVDQVRAREYDEIADCTIADRTAAAAEHLETQANALDSLAASTFDADAFARAMAKVDGAEGATPTPTPIAHRVPVA